MIFISNRLFDLIRGKDSLTKFLKEKDIEHYLFTCDLVEYNFQDVYKTFDVSFFSKNSDLISNKFADFQYLNDYESVDKFTENLIVILIKKFKLKISFRKNAKASNQIIISDTVDFDPDILHNTDSIIKIAIIKDNFEGWKDSNLNKFDYIFTFKEKISEFKGNNNCFVIKGETIYGQIKNILNELYKRKIQKFYYFIKDTGFNNVFPKKVYYFKILNSEYFDMGWYKEKYELTDNTDPVIHYLLIGSNKGYDPGPDFSSFEYSECNKDIGDMDPLIHYELYGRKENRILRISEIEERNYSLILNSPYFDKKWYEDAYDIHDEDSVSHYLNVGFAEGYNPGPDFSTFEYFICNADIKKKGWNPLLHYELYGRKEKRELSFSDERHGEDYDFILNSPYFDKDWYESTYDLTANEDSVIHYLNVGYALGYNPGPDFSTNDYYECNVDVKEYGMNPLIHYERFGREEGRKLKYENLPE